MGGVEEGGARGRGQLVQDCTVDVIGVGGRVGPQEVVDRLMKTERAKQYCVRNKLESLIIKRFYKCGWQVGVLGTLKQMHYYPSQRFFITRLRPFEF